MWTFILLILSLVILIYLYVKRYKIYDSSENLDSDTLSHYDKLDRAFIIIHLVTFGLLELSNNVSEWFNFYKSHGY